MPDDGYDKDKHPDPPWQWIKGKQKHPDKGDDGGVEGDYWELQGSANPTYNCATYTVNKVQGKAPDGTFVKEDEAIDKLTVLGYKETSGSKCGCGEGQIKNCTVIYRDKAAAPKGVFHVAVLDTKLCDWGGKVSGSEPIIRYKKPEDYLKRFEKEARDKSEMVFYCNDAESAYITDPDIKDKAKKPDEKKGEGKCLFVLVILIGLIFSLLHYAYAWAAR